MNIFIYIPYSPKLTPTNILLFSDLKKMVIEKKSPRMSTTCKQNTNRATKIYRKVEKSPVTSMWNNKIDFRPSFL